VHICLTPTLSVSTCTALNTKGCTHVHSTRRSSTSSVRSFRRARWRRSLLVLQRSSAVYPNLSLYTTATNPGLCVVRYGWGAVWHRHTARLLMRAVQRYVLVLVVFEVGREDARGGGRKEAEVGVVHLASVVDVDLVVVMVRTSGRIRGVEEVCDVGGFGGVPPVGVSVAVSRGGGVLVEVGYRVPQDSRGDKNGGWWQRNKVRTRSDGSLTVWLSSSFYGKPWCCCTVATPR
jgi:hypothetical protein